MKHIVVGVSPSTGSPGALRWAWEQGRLMDLPVRAVLAWRPPRPAGAPALRPPVTTYAGLAPEEEAEAILQNAVTEALGDGVDVDRAAVRGAAVPTLLKESKGAQMLVLGEPRPGRLNAVRTGLVAPQLVLRAACPVVVMPSPAHVPL